MARRATAAGNPGGPRPNPGRAVGDAPGQPLRRAERGVTLLEMIVVAAIVAVIVGISFPAASAGLDAIRLTSATQSVATFINGALNRAERRQEALQLVISPRDNLMTLYSVQPGYTRELKLPDGVALEAVLPAQPDDPDPVRRFILMPNTAAPAIGIQIANQHGSRRIVRLDPMTGFPRVESVGKK